MSVYLAAFVGRRAGALGVFYPIVTRVRADDCESARLRLYDRFEHIHGLGLVVVCGLVAVVSR